MHELTRDQVIATLDALNSQAEHHLSVGNDTLRWGADMSWMKIYSSYKEMYDLPAYLEDTHKMISQDLQEMG